MNTGFQSSEATDLQSITGRGIQATVEGDLAHVGKDDLFAEVAVVGLGSPDGRVIGA